MEPAGQMTAWTVAMDTLVKASAVAVGAASQSELQEQTAHAIAGPFADWAVVDLYGQEPERSVATARTADRALIDSLRAVSPASCPVISSAIRRGTPVVHASIDDMVLLGALPGGIPVAEALDAGSVAVAPICAPGGSCGAITVVRCSDRPYLGFHDLGVLSQIAELTAGAAERLRRPWTRGLANRGSRGATWAKRRSR
jgi:GAF domain-containing protein